MEYVEDLVKVCCLPEGFMRIILYPISLNNIVKAKVFP